MANTNTLPLNSYGNENEVGEGIHEVVSAGGIKREDLFVTSKLWNNRHRKENVRDALMESLTALKLDYLDLVRKPDYVGTA